MSNTRLSVKELYFYSRRTNRLGCTLSVAMAFEVNNGVRHREPDDAAWQVAVRVEEWLADQTDFNLSSLEVYLSA